LLHHLTPNACDIFGFKISNRKFSKYKPLTKNHKIKDLAFLSLNFAKKVLVLVDFFLDFCAKKP
jgi:hypothetical protein